MAVSESVVFTRVLASLKSNGNRTSRAGVHGAYNATPETSSNACDIDRIISDMHATFR